MAITPRLLTVAQAAVYLGMTERALRTCVQRRQVPIVKRGRAVSFDVRQLDAWIDEHTIEAAS
jgi:excisionase family DNA binding protein